MNSITEARSLLFVPGTRADRFESAVTSGADAVILDLEDSVAPSEKALARTAVERWLTADLQRAPSIAVRINAVGTPWHADDLRMAAAVGCPVLLPKADSVRALVTVRTDLPDHCPLIALIETARGVRDVASLCTSQSIDRLAFGSVDFAVELGLDPLTASATLTYARSTLVVSSAAAGLPPPVDGVTIAVDDPTRLASDLEDAVSIGFGGKLAVHPRQIAAINAAWTPSPALVNWAQRVMAATSPKVTAGSDDHASEAAEATVGVTTVDGQMVDLPVVTRARRILARANRVRQPTMANQTMTNGTT
jgi:citrate lyase subunit beta / citryl-CoA lyase